MYIRGCGCMCVMSEYCDDWDISPGILGYVGNVFEMDVRVFYVNGHVMVAITFFYMHFRCKENEWQHCV